MTVLLALDGEDQIPVSARDKRSAQLSSRNPEVLVELGDSLLARAAVDLLDGAQAAQPELLREQSLSGAQAPHPSPEAPACFGRAPEWLPRPPGYKPQNRLLRSRPSPEARHHRCCRFLVHQLAQYRVIILKPLMPAAIDLQNNAALGAWPSPAIDGHLACDPCHQPSPH